MKHVLVFFFAVIAYAHAQVPTREAFLRLSDAAKIEILYTHAQEGTARHLRNQTVLKELRKNALFEAGVWYDTILEGDYNLTGEVEVLNITAMVIQGQVYGYSALVKADAVNYSSCEYDYETETYGDDCTVGYIYQHMTFDFQGKFIENGDDYADFDS
jgi:hypothetical protein